MSSDVLAYLSDNYIKIGGTLSGESLLKDAKTGLAITDATVTATLFTVNGTPVINAQNLVATYDATTQAYWAIIPRTAGVAPGSKYRCDATVVKGALQRMLSLSVIVQRFPA